MRTISKFSSCDLKTGLAFRRSTASESPTFMTVVVVATSLNEIGRLSRLEFGFLRTQNE
jgi:hypothetical protein